MGRGRRAGGQSPAEPLSWEASHQVEEKVCFLGEFALENCLCFCERGHRHFSRGARPSFLLLECVCHRRQGSVKDGVRLRADRLSLSSWQSLGWTSATSLKAASRSFVDARPNPSGVPRGPRLVGDRETVVGGRGTWHDRMRRLFLLRGPEGSSSILGGCGA